MQNSKKCAIIIALVLFFLTFSICYAETSPMGCIKKNFDEIVSILKSPSFKQKTEKEQQDQIYEKLCSSFDFRIISMLALGRNWKRFSPSQKVEFSKYFSKLITNVYLSRIRGADLDDIKVDYLKVIDLKTKAKRSDVYTMLHHNDVKTPVVYRMIKKDSDSWKTYDVLIEGVSLIANYRETYREKAMVPPVTIINELKAKFKNEET